MLSTTKLWIWLSLSCAPAAAWRAWKHFGSVERVYAADEEALRAVPGLRQGSARCLLNKSTERAERILGRCERLGVYALCWEDEQYPQRLREIAQPPMVLYQWGQKLRLGEECAVAMAGSRTCSAYGQSMAARFARDFTRSGALVVTGMAPGCDETALRSALRAGGPVAVLLPGGVDVPWEDSAYYRSLYRDVRQMGVLLSPYPPGTRNDHQHFFYRNPVLTGLTAATLCVEAGVRSGVINVARHANDQHRPLYVVPANLDTETAAGTNALMCSGIALPVMSAQDILLPFQAAYPKLRLTGKRGAEDPIRRPPFRASQSPQEAAAGDGNGPKAEATEEKRVDTGPQADYIDLKTEGDSFTQEELSLLSALGGGVRTAEELSALTDLGSARTLASLTLLTLRGAVEELGGGRFRGCVRLPDDPQD